jgi:hypothetical protein
MSSFAEIELAGERIAAGLVPTSKISGDDETDTRLLCEMADDATRYITSFSWCGTVRGSYFGGGIGGIFAVFIFHIRPSRPEVDPWIWIMVGDIPPAYLPLSDSESPAEAFRTYMHGMSRWVEHARRGQTGTAEEDVPPVNVPATPEWAEELNQRLHGLTLIVKPLFEDAGDRSDLVQ